MNNESFSHVCTECRTPVDVQGTRASFLVVGVSKAVIATLLIAMLGWPGIALTIVWLIMEGVRFRKCSVCGGNSLIPVETPRGIRIMEDEGWHGSAQ